MKARSIVLGLTVTAILVAASGLALAAGSSSQTGDDTTVTPPAVQSVATPDQGDKGSIDLNAMHNSPQMREMHSQISPELQAQCDAHQAQMSAQMGSGAMTPSSMGTGQMGASMESHHSGAAG